MRRLASVAAALAVAVTCVFFAAWTLTGCAFFTKDKGGKVATAGIDIALCVLAHSSDPIPQIIATCGAENEQQVLNIFAAAQRANRRGFSRNPDADAGL